MVGDVALSYDSQAVIRSIRNLLLTNQYYVVFMAKDKNKIIDILTDVLKKLGKNKRLYDYAKDTGKNNFKGMDLLTDFKHRKKLKEIIN